MDTGWHLPHVRMQIFQPLSKALRYSGYYKYIFSQCLK